jgi:hypothetical protein
VPKIPTHQILDDDWDDDREHNIEQDEPRTKLGVKRRPKQDLEWEDQRRDHWRKKNHQD